LSKTHKLHHTRYKTLVALDVLSPILTCLFFAMQQKTTRTDWGEHCSPRPSLCPISVIGAGLPIPFLVDNLGFSVEGSLGFFEDEFRSGTFALDTLIYFCFGSLATRLATQKKLF
jgi:hypothetical protein